MIYFFFHKIAIKNGLTESKAISILKTAYPEFNSYPNDNLLPHSIMTEKDMNGW